MAELFQRYNPGRVRSLDLSLPVFMTRSIFRLIYECVFGDVKASSGKTGAIEVNVRLIEDLFGFVGEGFGVKTLSPVLGDEPLVARDVVGSRRGGILCL